jgi:glycosyltransferase involved in cell wall biosynthesis
MNRDGIEPSRVWTVHNGLDLCRFEREGSVGQFEHLGKGAGVTIGVVANLRPEKGHLVFLDAARRLRDRYPDARFLIVGEGPIRRQIEDRVAELGLNASVQMMGAVTNIPSVLRTMDIIVLPSLSNEGFPNAVMEAMAAGLPVVATDTGGTRELVQDGFTGYLIPPGDWTALSDRIGILCESAEARQKMGEAGRQRVVKGFTVERMARRFEALYSSLLAKKRCLI